MEYGRIFQINERMGFALIRSRGRVIIARLADGGRCKANGGKLKLLQGTFTRLPRPGRTIYFLARPILGEQYLHASAWTTDVEYLQALEELEARRDTPFKTRSLVFAAA